MSKPFGSMPQDAELAAWGTACGVFFLGAAIPNLVAAFVGARVTGGSSHVAWWIAVPMTAFALVVAVEARTWRSWPLRAAVLAFAVLGVLTIGADVRGQTVGPTVFPVLQGAMGAGLLFAAWPYAGRLARAFTVVIFFVFLVIDSGTPSILALVASGRCG